MQQQQITIYLNQMVVWSIEILVQFNDQALEEWGELALLSGVILWGVGLRWGRKALMGFVNRVVWGRKGGIFEKEERLKPMYSFGK